ncbi:MAG: M14 family zinc carboxypeptidase [Smithella sp.]
MCIVIAPLLNSDGFLSTPSTRVNANGVDINRNFPTKDGRQVRFING